MLLIKQSGKPCGAAQSLTPRTLVQESWSLDDVMFVIGVGHVKVRSVKSFLLWLKGCVHIFQGCIKAILMCLFLFVLLYYTLHHGSASTNCLLEHCQCYNDSAKTAEDSYSLQLNFRMHFHIDQGVNKDLLISL